MILKSHALVGKQTTRVAIGLAGENISHDMDYDQGYCHRQEDLYEFKAKLVYTVSSRAAKAT